MALTGVHVAFGGSSIGPGLGTEALLAGCTASSTMPTPATSVAAPQEGVASISSGAPIYYAVGPSPDASTSPRRYYDPAGGREDVTVNRGDKIAWIFA